MKKLFIHIGTHKTGSSAIQRALQLAEADMRKENIVNIPHEKAPDCLLNAALGSSFTEEEISTGKQFFDKWIGRAPDFSNFVFSHEDLSGDPFNGYKNSCCVAQALREMTKGREVIVIVYLRRQDFFVESFYNMRVRAGGSRKFNDFNTNVMKGTLLNWHDLLQNYSKFFGKENIIVRKYDKTQLPEKNSLIIDFADIIGSAALKKVALAKFYNAGINRDALEVLRLCNRYLDKKGKAVLRKALEKTSSKMPLTAYSFFAQEKRKEFLENFAETNELVAKEYLHDDSTRLFPEVSNEESFYKEITPEAVAEILSKVVVDTQSPADEPASLSIIRKIIRNLFSLIDKVLRKLLDFFPFLKRAARRIAEKHRSN